jgi:capsular exopolysaccharide synthesis family protein
VNAFAEERQGGARYLEALREHWLLVVSLIVVAVGAAAAYSFTAAERYEAGADLLVAPVPADDDTFIGFSLLRESDQSRSVLTAARLIETPQVADGVRRQLGLQASREKILGDVEVRPQEQSNIVTVVAQGATAERAAALANGFVEVTIERRTARFQTELRSVLDRLSAQLEAIPADQRGSAEAVALQRRLGELSALVGAPDPTLQLASRAVAPASSVWPRPVLSIAVAFLAALLLGTGAAVAFELLNPQIKREEELLLDHRLPILARVPRMRRKTVRSYLLGREPLPGDVREAFRTLRATLAASGREGGFPQTVLVTSAVPGEGKTMTAVNLAVTLSLAGMRVVLVDGDLRRPMVGTVFRVPAGRSGFVSLLHGEVSFEQALLEAPGHGDRLQLLLSNPDHGFLVDLLRRDQIERVLAELKLHADVVVVDSPPLTEVADALTLADAVEAVVVSVRLGRTRRDKLGELRRMLGQLGVTPLGFVVITRSRPRRSGYYYGAPEPPRSGLRRSERRPALTEAREP